MSYLNTPQAGAPTTPIGPLARRWAPLIGFLAGLLVLTLIGAVVIATAVHPSPMPTAAPRAILCFFDYTRPESAAAITSADVEQVVGMAGAYRLVEVAGGARVWIALADVPAGTPVIAPLPDLAPPTPAPAPTIIYVPVPIVAPQVEPTPAHFEMPSDRPGPPTATPPPLLSGERLDEYFQRTGVTPVSPFQVR